MKNQDTPSAFHFKRPQVNGLVQVLNERSYVMGEYNQRTGKVSWHRLVAATQKATIETYLLERYPVQ